MSLREYRRKRNFQRTPEPSASSKTAAAPGRKFVVQKHAARRLHYDFRLELDGVLKSWAVPKGPSLDPTVKSLAVHVEDHPLAYADFEGVIPAGEYGGGTVMVWDRGLWKPLGDPAKAYRAGRLKFELQGEKLHGQWSLVKMSGAAAEEGDNWLLIKSKDNVSRSGRVGDVTARLLRSVHSGRDMDQIAADADRVWTSGKSQAANAPRRKRKPKVAIKGSNRTAARQSLKEQDVADLPQARRALQPDFVAPQLAMSADDVPKGDAWLHELKFDGYRLVIVLKNGKARIFTRQHNDWTHRFSGIAAAIERLGVENAIFDGEVVVLRPDGTTDFQRLQNWMKQGQAESLVYYVFDLPWCGGFDLTKTPLVRRKELLARLLLGNNASNDGPLRYSEHIVGHGAAVVKQACRAAMEGVVSKRADSRYESRRTPAWRKIKCLQRQEFVIGGYTKPSGSRQGFGALLLGVFADEQDAKREDHNAELERPRLVYCGRVGTGFTAASLRELAGKLKPLRAAKSPFDPTPASARRGGVTWVEPRLVAEVEFANWTTEGLLRHPSFQGLRDDKSASHVRRETARPNAELDAAVEDKSQRPSQRGSEMSQRAAARRTRPSAGTSDEASPVAGVRISNPNRVVFPEQGLTKLDLARYYEDVADWILPHVVDRPLSLVRCPRGSQHACFFQKHLTESMPGALRGVEIPEENETRIYVAIDDLLGLISLIQMGVLELHPWGARSDQLERPDRLVFDLDPGPDVAWDRVIAAAQAVRSRLQAFDLESFVRTSGGKGLHVVVPLHRRVGWDDAKEFTRGIAENMVRQAPQEYVATVTKSKRRGKILIDYFRNGRGATAVASYSTRAREGAPVATPVHWDELSRVLKPTQFHVANVPLRLGSQRRGDPWAGFFKVRQSLTQSLLRAARQQVKS